MRVFLQVWTNYILYIYTWKKKIRVHICSTETFSFLVSEYFFRLCPHLVLSEHSLTNKSSLKKSPMKNISVQLYCFVGAEVLCGDIIFDDVLIWKVSRCFKVGCHICWLERKGKEGFLSKVEAFCKKTQFIKIPLLKILRNVQNVTKLLQKFDQYHHHCLKFRRQKSRP